MLPPSKYFPSHLINTVFIAGVTQENIEEIILKNEHTDLITPDLLFSYPQSKDSITPAILDFVFADGISIGYTLSPPKFYCIVLTNETGVRSFIYILKMNESIDINNKKIYIPYTICIWSPINHTESFKQILIEMYHIIKSNDINLSEETIINFHNCELVNLIIFICDIIIPSNYTKLILNCHFSKIEFYFPSLWEIPRNDECINILFNCLEISSIIKIWCSLLCEKHVILLANQSFLLYSICEAILSLMFPFRWLHTYIPILPSEQLTYLESPTPYLMGVLSTKVDYELLNELYSSHVICDVNTSIINKNGVSILSTSEEEKLRKKLQYIKNPDMFDIEDIFEDEEDKMNFKINFNIEDIDRKKSFGENVHYIFFRVFRNSLNIMKKHFTEDKVFNVESFLNDELCKEDMREFWEKVTSTVAFEHFIISFKNLDDSLSKIFRNILSDNSKLENNDQKKLELLTIELSLPHTFNFIIDQIETNEDNEEQKKIKSDLENMRIDYSIAIAQLKKNLKLSISPDDKKILWKKKCRKRKEFYSNDFDFSHSKNITPDLDKDRVLIKSSQKKIRNSNSLSSYKIQKTKFLNNTNNSEVSIQLSQINKKQRNLFPLYSNRNSSLSSNSNKDNKDSKSSFIYNSGFLSFCDFIFEKVTLKNGKKLNYREMMTNQIISILNSSINKSFNNQSEIIEQSIESFNSSNLEQNSFNEEEIRLTFDKNLFYFSSINCYQFYQFCAFLLNEYSQTYEKEQIIKLFEESFNLCKRGFCRARFYQFLDCFSYFELSLIFAKLTQKEKESNTLIMNLKKNKFLSYKLIKKIIQLKLSKMNKKQKKNEKTSSKSLLSISSKKDIGHTPSSSGIPSNTTNQNNNINNNPINSNLQSNLNINNNIHENEIKTNKINEIESPLNSPSITKRSSINVTPKRLFLRRNTVVIQRKNTMLLKKKNTTLTQDDFESFQKSFLNDHYDGITDGEKIMELLKKENETKRKIVRINALNLFEIIKETDKGPLELIEQISVSLFSLIIKKSLNKLQTELISNQLLLNICNSNEFQEIKLLVAELQAVDLKNIIKVPDFNTCFWLNIYNFLTIFTIILKREVPLTFYEWYRLIKNTYFKIGGFFFSLYEIECVILKNVKVAKEVYGEIINFKSDDMRNNLIIQSDYKYLPFCICIPSISSPNLQIYFPNSLQKQILRNAIEYFNNRITIDMDNYLIKIPELLTWIEENFIDKLDTFQE